jgi:hypothetical protein
MRAWVSMNGRRLDEELSEFLNQRKGAKMHGYKIQTKEI